MNGEGAEMVCVNGGEQAVLPEAAEQAAQTTDRIVAVRYLEGSAAQLSYFRRTDGGWKMQLSCAAHVGKNGIGKTREGDMKTPLGTFSLTVPFGILPDPSQDDPKGRAVPRYFRVTDQHYWCGQDGPHYNRLIDNAAPPAGYSPADADEHLIRFRPAYHYAMFIGYNPEGAPGLGSAIFLHCMGRNPYTAGCVAVAEEHMKELILELGEHAKIVIYE